MLKQTSLSPY